MFPLFRFAAVVGVMQCAVALNACDLCGTGSANGTMGLLPLMQRHFVGIRWQTQGFFTDAHGGEPDSYDDFRSLDLWGRWQPHRRVQVVGALPLSFFERRFNNGVRQSIYGLGDASVSMQYALLNSSISVAGKWRHIVQIGGGLKLPTAATRKNDPEGQPYALMVQPGTGSVDVQISGLYALQRKAWGLSLDIAGRLNGANRDNYRFGHRLSAGLRAFWTKKGKHMSATPFAGLAADARLADTDKGYRQSETGGCLLFAITGMELTRDRFSLHLQWQNPLAGALSEGAVTPRLRFNAGVVCFLGSKTPGNRLAKNAFFKNINTKTQLK